MADENVTKNETTTETTACGTICDKVTVTNLHSIWGSTTTRTYRTAMP